MMTMKASSRLIEHLKKSEGCRLSAYQDVAGVWTIGYGHTKNVKPGDKITSEQAETYLLEDIFPCEKAARTVPGVNTQGKFDAVVDFIYNCGLGNFNTSTLRKYIVGGREIWEIQEQFLRWVNSGGKKYGGLVSRRIWEAARFAE